MPREFNGLLSAASVDTVVQPFAEGLIGESSRFKTRVGVWLMPDNQTSGALERFLKPLISANNQPLHELAINGATQAQQLALQKQLVYFRDVDQLNAELACWPACQKKSGLPYGIAIQAGYLDANEAAARTFAAWFKWLFHL